MLQAVETPVLKTAAFAGVALALLVGFTTGTATEATHKRLVLHAPKQCGALYLTAWENGDVIVASQKVKQSITFQQRAFINDGCEWLATEKLTPMADGRMHYSYDEEILSCQPGSTPALKTPRTGYVTIHAVR